MYSLRVLLFTTTIVVLTSYLLPVQSSGIPMWEYLNRGEKVSRLFHVFMRQVDDYCNTSTMPDCNKQMMVHGLSSLARMEDDHLDAMDPYQRDAHGIIWDAMMKDHDKQPEQQANSEAANDNNQLPSNLKEASSNQDIVYASTNGDTLDMAPPPPPPNHRHHPEAVGGPMVVRVLPDGSPVPGDPPGGRSMPPDMDMIEYRMMNTMPHHHPAVISLRPQRQAKYPFRRFS